MDHLQEMCNEVAEEIREHQTELGYKQSAELVQRGTFKKLFFNPKLHEGNHEVCSKIGRVEGYL